MPHRNTPAERSTLHLNYEDAYKPKIEDPKEMWGGSNKDFYLITAQLIDNIMSNSRRARQSEVNEVPFNSDWEANNIIAYTGDRGIRHIQL